MLERNLRRAVCASFFLLVGAVFAAPVYAQTTTYECNMDVSRQRGWISPVIFIAHNEATGEAIVSDSVVLNFNDGQPIKAKVAKNNSQRLTVAWTVKAYDSARKRATMKYRATYVKSNGKLSVVASPLGYANTFTRGGTCKRGKLKR